LARGGFQAGTDTSKALTFLAAANTFDQKALDALSLGDSAEAEKVLLLAAISKSWAELAMRGHDPQPGPFPDGLGGFDTGDPKLIVADGWSSRCSTRARAPGARSRV